MSSVGLLVAKSSISGSPSSGESSSSENDRPVFLSGIGPRGRSASFFLAFAFGPRWGLASGPKFRPRGGGGADGSNGRGAPKPPLDRGGPLKPPPARGGPLKPPGRGPEGPRSSRARASLTARGRPLNTCPLNRWMACSACARSLNSTNANPRGRPVSRSTGRTTCDGGATAPKYARRSASVVLYDRLPTNKRTANQLSP